jgi:hypothetical protein
MGNEDLGMRNAGMQECRNAGMQECRNAGMQECRNAGMQEEDEEVGERKVMGDASLPAGCVKLCGGA